MTIDTSILRNDWGQPVSTTSAYSTDTFFSEDQAPQRVCQGLITPTLSSTHRLRSTSGTDQRAVKIRAYDVASQEFWFPLFSDPTFAEQDTLTGSSEILCDTSFKRFKDGGKAFVIQTGVIQSPEDTEWQLVDISSVLSDRIVLTTLLSIDISKDAIIVPAFLSLPIFDNSLRPISSVTSDLNARGLETSGVNQIGEISAIGTNPLNPTLATIDNLPIFPNEYINFTSPQWRIVRPGSNQALGIGSIPAVRGVQSEESWSIQVLCNGRDRAWDVLSFFQSRGGNLLPFWYLTPVSDFGLSVTRTSSITVTVPAVGDVSFWNQSPYLGFKDPAGGSDVLEILNVVRGSGIDTITVQGGSIPAGTIEFFTAYRCRFGDPELTETWTNDIVMSSTLNITQIVDESVVSTPDIPAYVSGNVGVGFASTCVAPPEGLVCPSIQDWIDNPTSEYFVEFAEIEFLSVGCSVINGANILAEDNPSGEVNGVNFFLTDNGLGNHNYLDLNPTNYIPRLYYLKELSGCNGLTLLDYNLSPFTINLQFDIVDPTIISFECVVPGAFYFRFNGNVGTLVPGESIYLDNAFTDYDFEVGDILTAGKNGQALICRRPDCVAPGFGDKNLTIDGDAFLISPAPGVCIYFNPQEEVWTLTDDGLSFDNGPMLWVLDSIEDTATGTNSGKYIQEEPSSDLSPEGNYILDTTYSGTMPSNLTVAGI